MSKEYEFVSGIYPKERKDTTPDFVLGNFSVRISQLKEFMDEYANKHPGEEWMRVQMLMGRSGKPFAAIDDWKPEQKAEPAPKANELDDDLPF